MKHCLKTKYIVTEDNEIKDVELLNLINEREEIKVGTQVIMRIQGKEILLEVIEIKNNEVWWEIRRDKQ
jgi:hypothetical protein